MKTLHELRGEYLELQIGVPPRVRESTQLFECSGMPESMYSYQQDPEDRMRAAIGMLVQAVMDAAQKNIDDDGTMWKHTDYTRENGPWVQAEALLRKELNMDKLGELKDVVRAKLREYRV